ncbi:flagellar biosynthesis protein FlhF [Alkalihalobacillus sp. LMS39]|uniref:flagellar biosynthesis protein FlhF n=1 Tax=Alkalihalobacillus sp. LMS39 TaxID=2924032 RepID=UPI001FB56412|nr:flagellar biosynthesis protein FlhF [Alkalihalobacillus sp. LMS39]UOE92822.1 flagellar biosynthesis protein FlhF [Alkalihalobacillus sp. LMS39]
MKVKKFTAASMPEAMKQIRAELGHDAVILNSKEVETGGLFGFFTKKSIEVIAAIDQMPQVKRPTPKPVQPKMVKQEIEPVFSKERIEKLKPSQDQEQLMKEIQQLKTMVHTISNQQQPSEKEYPEPFQQIEDQLLEQEVNKSIRLELMKHLLKKWYSTEKEESEQMDIAKEVKAYLEAMVADVDMGGIDFSKKYINIVGPTGVGKTTTIAKIAAHSVLKKHKKVALITTDTYRIAAVEQLKTYSKILNIPFEVAYSIEDFRKAKEQFSSYDLVLVDSAGRNFRNSLYVEEIRKIIDFNDEMETYLVLALTSKYKDMKSIFEQFSLISIQKLIFTKKDETSYYGAMLNMMHDYHVGVAYITTGQNVPDDIVEADSDTIINAILEGNEHD